MMSSEFARGGYIRGDPIRYSSRRNKRTAPPTLAFCCHDARASLVRFFSCCGHIEVLCGEGCGEVLPDSTVSSYAQQGCPKSNAYSRASAAPPPN
jgi:hypothetical protein